MFKHYSMKTIPMIANIISAAGIATVLIAAYICQLSLHEAPCPLCLLQRLGFLLAGTGLLFNLRYGENFSHYTFILLSMVYTGAVALRQVSLHVVPGTGNFGSSLLGFHLYTWSFIISVLVIIATAVALGFESKNRIGHQYFKEKPKRKEGKVLHCIVTALFLLIFLLAISNAFYTLMLCGLHACPENP